VVILEPGERASVPFVWSNWCAAGPDAPFTVVVTLPDGSSESATVFGADDKPAGGFPRCIDQNAPSVLAVGAFAADDGPTDDGTGGGRTGDGSSGNGRSGDRHEQGHSHQGFQTVTTLPKTGAGPAGPADQGQGSSFPVALLISILVAVLTVVLTAIRILAS
jgi:hypothetical protein